MPNLLAHYLFVKRFYLLEKSKNRDSINQFLVGNPDFFELGTQGPDPLFFVGIIPSHGLHLITAKKKYGNQLHKTDGREFFIAMINRSYKIEDDKNRKRFQSFIFGQFAHYILDREAHPYILYKSGFDSEGKISGKYHYLHGNFETNIDVALAKKHQMNVFLERPYDIIPCDKYFLALIDRDLGISLKEAFRLEKPLPKHFYTNAIKNMRSIQKFMNRHRKFNRAMLPKRIQSPVMPDPDKLDYPDCLNDKREEWLDPVTGESHYESFEDINYRASKILESCYEDLLREGFNFQVFARYLDNRDYYGTEIGKKRVYQKNPIINK